MYSNKRVKKRVKEISERTRRKHLSELAEQRTPGRS